MRHQKSGRKLNRDASHRSALMGNLAVSLLRHGKITTTEAKAKELRGYVEHMVTLGKRGDLHARRQAFGVLRDKEVVDKLFSEIAELNRARKGGYTRVLKTGFRYGDCAPMSMIELVEKPAQ